MQIGQHLPGADMGENVQPEQRSSSFAHRRRSSQGVVVDSEMIHIDMNMEAMDAGRLGGLDKKHSESIGNYLIRLNI